MVSKKVNKKIEIWKKKLLDLGMRNRLLNYKDTKASTLNILFPDYQRLYKLIAVDEKTLVFPHIEAKALTSADLMDEGADEPEDPALRVQQQTVEIPGDIRTDRSVRETHHIAKTLRDKTRTAYEEQGVNVLYLSIGFLEWQDHGKVSEHIRSPLVLIPVALSIDSISDPYKLSLHEDEIVVNPTLAYKLETEFGLHLPPFEPQNDDIKGYLDSVEHTVAKQGWSVSRNVTLSMLSFLKINMYQDLEQHKDSIAQHTIIRALSGEPVERAVDVSFLENYDLDREISPVNTFQVVDADSSQQDAIVLSKKNASFALQGPPGTGKSQTITNIIAEALADGKKVLFVSEKMAALEVVYRRLAAAGLSDFCLVLHSNKANKREFLDSLRQVLSLKPIAVRDSALYRLQMLEAKRDRLNRYSEELHRVIEPLHQSVFEANGILSRLKDAPNIVFTPDGTMIRSISKEKLHTLRLAVVEFAKASASLTEDYQENTWRNSRIKTINHEVRHDLSALFDELADTFSAYLDKVRPSCETLSLDLDVSFPKIAKLAEALHFCAGAKPFPKEWLGDPNLNALIEQAKILQGRQTEERSLGERLEAECPDSLFHQEANPCLKAVDGNIAAAREQLDKTYEENGPLLDHLDELLGVFSETAKCLSEETEVLKSVCKHFNVPVPKEQHSVAQICELLENYHHPIKASGEWFAPGWSTKAGAEQLEAARAEMQEIERRKEEILSEYEPEILKIDYSEMLTRFKTAYTSFFRFLNGSYKADHNTIRACCRTPAKKLSYDTMLSALERVKGYHDALAALKEKEETYRQMLGGWYNGTSTDFDRISQAFEKFDAICGVYQGRIPNTIRDELVSGVNVETDTDAYDRLKALAGSPCLSEFFSISQRTEADAPDSLAEKALSVSHALRDCRDTLRALPFDADVTLSARYTVLSDLARLQQLQKEDREKSEQLRSDYGFLFEELETDWSGVLDLLAWVSRFKDHARELGFSAAFQADASAARYTREYEDLSTYLNDFFRKNRDAVNRYYNLFTNAEGLDQAKISEFLSKVRRCLANMKGLEDWLDFYHAKEHCERYGLGRFVEEVLKQGLDSADMEAAFLKRFERLWLDAVTPDLPEVERFRGSTQDDLIREFRELDREQLQITRGRIREKLINGLPNINHFTSSKDEVGILMHEMGKQRKIMPVRRMFDSIPNLLPRLKPCMMMSPLSVSQFLQSKNYVFDLVIFDEASQVRTENAIGAISRGKQVVVAGDIHQLPPTSFFASTISGSDEYDETEEDDSEAFESVLDETIDILPQLTLKWHYRSRNESLIAFSNRKIYHNSLVTFPSPSEDLQNEGVEYIYVPNGLYQRSGKRNNPIEAKKTADVIFEQLRLYPKRSIGVITFSEAQQRCVEAEVLARRIADPAFEEYFSEGREEPFFIKNLENVQGDERDTIIFSIGYAKSNPLEELRMNFGPLNQNGGYRRLNVAVTRAKYAIKLVGSILPTDMRINDATPKGVKLLHDYIEFAQKGVQSLDNELSYSNQVQTESEFEDSVYDYLTQKGYQVATQVGCSGYRIDMAVRHPTLHGRFVLGVECDGASYHSSRTARERDRLRQEVLESMGWRFYRVWSTDWIKDPVTEGKRLTAAVEKALREYREPELLTVSAPKKAVNAADYVEEVELPAEADDTGYGFAVYQEKTFQKRGDEVSELQIAQAINEIIDAQAPVHIQLIYKQIAPLFGLTRVSTRVKSGVDAALNKNARKHGWDRRGDFLWRKGQTEAEPRVAGDAEKPRSLDLVAPEELSAAMLVVISKSYGLEKDGLFRIIAREYGVGRVTAAATACLENALNLLLKETKVQSVEGKLSLC